MLMLHIPPAKTPEISRIDRRIAAVKGLLRKRVGNETYLHIGVSAAWERHPDLQARLYALQDERFAARRREAV